MAASGYDLRALRLHLGKHRRPSHPISTSGALLAAIVAEAMAKAMAGSPNQRKTAQRRLRRLDGYMEQAVRKVLATKKSAAREGC